MKRTSNGVYLPFHTEAPRDYIPAALPSLDGVDTVYLDAETRGLDWHKDGRPVGWAVKPKGRPAVYLPFAHRGGGNLPEERVREWWACELRGKRICNINTKFDVNMARAWGLHLEDQGCTFHDVAHDAALLDDHRRTFNLEDLSQDRLQTGKGNTGLPPETIADQPAWQVAPYACRDVELVERLDDSYAPAIAAEDLGRVRHLEDEVLPAAAEMEWNGMPVNEGRLAQWLEQTAAILDKLRWEIYRQCGFDVNPNRSVDLQRLFIAEGLAGQWGLTPKDKKPSFDAAVMRAAAAKSPKVALVFKAAKLEDLRSKFFIPYSKVIYNGRIRGTLHQLRGDDGGTISGRFSMVKPNLQAVLASNKEKKLYGDFDGLLFPVRDLFEAPAGQSWFCADQMQVEFRVMGHYSQSKRIIETYQKPHAEREVDGKMVAYQGPLADFHIVVMDMIRTQEPNFQRRETKDYNFATGYGAGAAKRASMVGVSIQREAEINAIYRKEFPELGATLKRVAEIAEKRGYVCTILGRRSRCGDRPYKGLNAICQGTAGEINKRCLVEVHKERKRLGVEPVSTVHDEFGALLRDRQMAPKVMEILNTQWIPLRVPILWDGGVAPEGGPQTWAAAKG